VSAARTYFAMEAGRMDALHACAVQTVNWFSLCHANALDVKWSLRLQ
jgi:hypothetical protein